MPHSELEGAREGALRRRAGDEALQDAEARMRLHQPHQLDDFGARHQAVGIERQHEVVGLAPPLQKIAHIAGLIAVISLAAAIGGAAPVGKFGLPGVEQPFLLTRNLGDVGVAQDEEVKMLVLARPLQALAHDSQPREGAGRVFVAQGHQDGGAQGERSGCRVMREGRYLPERILDEMQQPEADQRVPEAHDRPGRGNDECRENADIEGRPAIAAQHAAEHIKLTGNSAQRQKRHDHAPAEQDRFFLKPGRRKARISCVKVETQGRLVVHYLCFPRDMR